MERAALRRDFPHIAIDFPEEDIFFRLGGNRFKTVLSPQELAFYQHHCRQAFSLIAPCGRFAVEKIGKIYPDGVETGDEFLPLGEKFTAAANGANCLWYAAVTVGKAIVDARDKQSQTAISAIFDAVGSECADKAMDTIFQLAHAELLRQGALLHSRRFSPGYGDMPLELQKFFHSKLAMSEMGVEVTGNLFLTPEKSVTAFAFVNRSQETD